MILKRSRLRSVLSGPRIVRFGTVAASCTLLQLLVLALAARLGMNKILANGLGFVLAAQVNFVLSARWTWRDRPRRSRGPLARWGLFNGTALAALGANELMFALLTWSGVPFLAASLCGIACGAALAFSLNHTVTFREHAARPRVGTERRPPLGDIRTRAQQDGVAFFLPAYHEAANLRVLVPRTVRYFDRLGCPFTVIIVDNGSTRDDTYETAERLAQAFPGQVQAVHHAQNRGYGAAVRSGIRAALRTPHSLIAFCDADGQFDIESFGTLLASLLLNPVMWVTTLGYIVARLAPFGAVSAFIDRLFPAPVFYAGIMVAVAGNAVLFAQKLFTPLRQQQEPGPAPGAAGQHPLARYLRQQEYGLTPRLLLTPLWWAFTSVSAVQAMRRLLVPSRRSAWDKTPHGHALDTELALMGGPSAAGITERAEVS